MFTESYMNVCKIHNVYVHKNILHWNRLSFWAWFWDAFAAQWELFEIRWYFHFPLKLNFAISFAEFEFRWNHVLGNKWANTLVYTCKRIPITEFVFAIKWGSSWRLFYSYSCVVADGILFNLTEPKLVATGGKA